MYHPIGLWRLRGVHRSLTTSRKASGLGVLRRWGLAYAIHREMKVAKLAKEKPWRLQVLSPPGQIIFVRTRC